MRLKLGRPDISEYASNFDVPASRGDISVTFLGVATLLFQDGRSAVLTDGFFSRPSLLSVGLGKIAPETGRIEAALDRLGLRQHDGLELKAVIPVHTHYDHVMDSAVVAERTGAALVGGESAANVGRGAELAEERIVVVKPDQPLTLDDFNVTFLESEHCPPDRFPGTIDDPVVPPAKTAAYRCGEAWSLLVEHVSGRTALVQGSAGYRAGSLAGRRADVAYLGVGQLGVQDETYICEYWEHTVQAVGAHRVVLVHWDDFFRPLDRPLRALPYAGDDLDVTMRILSRLAKQQGVSLHLPTVWRQEDPWQGLP